MNDSAFSSSLRDEVLSLLDRLGVVPARLSEGTLIVRSPITGEVVAAVEEANGNDVAAAVARSSAAFANWRTVPARRRVAAPARRGATGRQG